MNDSMTIHFLKAHYVRIVP